MEAETVRPVTGLAELPGVHDLTVTGQRVRFAVDAEHLDAAIKALGAFGISSLVCQPPTLEEIMLHHYGDELNHQHVGATR